MPPNILNLETFVHVFKPQNFLPPEQRVPGDTGPTRVGWGSADLLDVGQCCFRPPTAQGSELRGCGRMFTSWNHPIPACGFSETRAQSCGAEARAS